MSTGLRTAAAVSGGVTVPLVTALDALWVAIQQRHPEVPDVVLTLGSGSLGEHRGQLRLGHFAADRWQHGNNERLPELFVGGEGLQRRPAEILGTLLHEAAHGLAHVRGIKDTSRQGRYHNTRFKTLAEELGITVEHAGTIGWSHTTVPEHTATDYAAELDQLAAALTAYRHREPGAGSRGGTTGKGGGRTSNNNGTAATCACGRRIRTAQTTLAAGPITCGLCGSDFTVA